jgi:glycine dehydrogenase subunit 1
MPELEIPRFARNDDSLAHKRRFLKGMRYTQLTEPDVKTMLDAIGAESVDDLFSVIPKALRRREPLSIPKGLGEQELLGDTGDLARRNRNCADAVCFLGGGAYDHFVPTIVDAVAGQTEFLTAYTPYQAEASQGILQLFYEFQTMICQLTGMEVANASLYEGATAAAEAALMALSITRRRRVLLADSVHPDTKTVLTAYMRQQEADIVSIPAPEGVVDEKALRKQLNGDTAALLVQSPNFFGCVERLDRMIPLVHEHGALAIVFTDPISCGLLKGPGDLGADIVVGEGQPLGIPLQYGGPYLGLLAAREQYLRKMPGRIVGMTTDAQGRRGFCLTLQTREQHIKRERATSNICTNQGLLAIRAAVYMAAMGKSGITDAAEQCFDRAHYAASRIGKLRGYAIKFAAPFFKEFVVQCPRRPERILAACRERGILAGVPLGQFDERLSDCVLTAVTEKRTRKEIDALTDALATAV